MKKKLFIISAILCVLALAAIVATKASADCAFIDENGDLYVCATDYVICESAPSSCKGIKFLSMPGHPTI